MLRGCDAFFGKNGLFKAFLMHASVLLLSFFVDKRFIEVLADAYGSVFSQEQCHRQSSGCHEPLGRDAEILDAVQQSRNHQAFVLDGGNKRHIGAVVGVGVLLVCQGRTHIDELDFIVLQAVFVPQEASHFFAFGGFELLVFWLG